MLPRALTLFVLLSAVIGGALGREVPTPEPGLPRARAVEIHALREAERLQANADFWMTVAQLSGDEHPLPDIEEAWEERNLRVVEVEEAHRRRTVLSTSLEPPRSIAGREGEFTAAVTNEFFPLVPGRALRYEMVTAEGLETLVVEVLDQVREIDGVPCRVVEERAELDGELEEIGTLWFAQDAAGAVWDFGESDRQYEDGFLEGVDGSWRAGHRGGVAGVIMDARPEVGPFRRMGHAPGIDEDITRVVATNVSVTLSNGSTHTNCVQIEERDPVEGGSADMKYFAPGVGLVLEVDLVTGERNELVQITGN